MQINSFCTKIDQLYTTVQITAVADKNTGRRFVAVGSVGNKLNLSIEYIDGR